MRGPILVSARVVIPAKALSFRALRSSGPGGQNVNKVASKVELRVDLSRIEGLPADARERLEGLTAHRRDAEGWLLVTSQRTRDQGRNLEDALGKVRALLLRALAAPAERRPTSPSGADRERRLAEKRRAAQRKRLRRRPGEEE